MTPPKLIRVLTDTTAVLIAIAIWLLMCAAFTGLLWLGLRILEWAGVLAVY